ncbi:MAG: glycosidase [Candidatus Harrisonbacteria bacterium]|nr:glycosidase [Candidatus Harrisonbacteria bacterium]
MRKNNPVKKAKIIKRALSKRVKKSNKKISPIILVKSAENPIIAPKTENKWEAWQTFNPGVILLNGKVYFLYRAIGEDGLSRLGYAMSGDGFTIDERLSYPVFEHKIKKRSFNIYSYFSGGSWGGAEDPRPVRINEEDTLYMTYTACDNGLRVGLTSIKINDFLNKKWYWKPSVFISPPGEVHKNWVIFPEKINGQYAILHSVNPEILIDYFDDLNFENGSNIKSFHGGEPRKNCWDKWMRGVGSVPIKTKYGWLVFYHAMNDDWSKYKVGAMLLDLNDPTKILHRFQQPILEPTEVYENNGFKAGVVYASGAVVKDGKLLIYYGAADSYISVAYADFEEFLEALRKDARPKLKQGLLQKNI